MRKNKVEEVEVVNEVETKKQNKEYDKLFFGILLSVFIVILVLLGIFLLFDKVDNIGGSTHGDDVEIKYSDVATEVKPGIYITDVSEVVENVMPSIVSITSKTLVQSNSYFPWFGQQEYESVGAGSGIILAKSSSELLIVTNYHVVEDTKEIVVTFIDEENVNAYIKGFSERKDIAVIAVKLSDIKKETLDTIRMATLGNSNELKVGNGIVAIGNALGYGQSVTVGVVSALNRKIEGDTYSNNMIQLDAAINGGNSGGALLNSKGEVVGINSAKYSSNGSSSSASIEGMGFAIPISDITELIESLSKGEAAPTGATIGISGYMIDEATSKSYNMPVGFYISEIVEGSGADKSELDIGNIVTKIDKVEVNDFNDISNYLYEKKAGDKIKLTVKYVSGRSYKEKEVTVTLQ